MKDVVEAITVTDDRRHGSAHMLQWLSLQDLPDQVAAKCPEGTPIPSKSLVRLQFTPSNPYTRTALTFTSRIPLQHKIQRRQLRAAHPDAHYCAAQYKYLRNRVVAEGSNTVMFSYDDEAKVHVGEPGAPVSIGVRGKTSITTSATTLEALDHDLYKSSLTPNAVLKCKIPDSVEKSFVRGQVYVSVSDSVFQASNPFRHGVMLKNIYNKSNELASTLLKYTDGGTDQRNTLESVKIANICLFRELHLDMRITGRCAPGHSFTNPAERIMAILNIGLQKCATERTTGEEDFEMLLKSCNSMQGIRDHAKKSNINIAELWQRSIQPVQDLISERFSRLKLKDDQIQLTNRVIEDEII